MGKITFLGGGSFGTALAMLISNKGYEVAVWDREQVVVEEINNNRTNDKYLKNITIPKGVTAYGNIDEAIKGADIVVIAVPSHVVRKVCKQAKEYITKDMILVSIAKGLEEDSFKRMSEVIEDELQTEVVVLSGPSHAEEVAQSIPTTIVASSKNMKRAEKIQDVFMSSTLRVYTNDDLIGVEIGGSVKNIIAVATGICDGLGYGDNAKAAIMTRGMKEISRIGLALGGKERTFYGLTGMGDLIVTCTSMHSRNRKAGMLIGQGEKAEDAVKSVGMVVEGVIACRAFYNFKNKMNIVMPITDILYKILYEGKDIRQCAGELMERDKKPESH
jgi:glycerol-3-phosphate dehydrogenase (NAD(P)+)